MSRFFGLNNPTIPFSWTEGPFYYNHRNNVSVADTSTGAPFYSGVEVASFSEAVIAIKTTGEWAITLHGGVRCYPPSSRDWDKIESISGSDSRVYKIDCIGLEYIYITIDSLTNPVDITIGVL